MRFLLDNLALKLVSLGLAVVLWFVIAGEKTSEMGLAVPVQLENFPRELELTGDAVNSVEVRLRASPGVIQRLGAGDVSAHLNLASLGEGEHILHLGPDSISVPFGVKVVRINPSIITLNLDRTLQKVVPVRPRLLGRPAAGHEVLEVSADPAEVRMAGPKRRVQEVESAFTEPVSVESAETTVVDDVNIGLEDPQLRILGSPRVRVTVRVGDTQGRRVFDTLPIAVRGGTASLQPSTVRVVVTGPAEVLARLKASDLRPFVDVPSQPGVNRATVGVEVPADALGLTVAETRPAEVAIQRKKKS